MMNIKLPKRENISITSKTDPIHRHFHPVIRYFMNKRLEVILNLMGRRHFNRLLDAGYGGGVFLHELSTRCNELYGIDVHEYSESVQEMLRKEDIKAQLKRSDIKRIDFPENFFDGVVCLSTLEFIDDVYSAIKELKRVTREGGAIFLGFPIENVLTEIAFRLILINPGKVHKVNHGEIIRITEEFLNIKRVCIFPFFLPREYGLFMGCEATKD